MVVFLNKASHMNMIPTRFIKELWDVDRRLAELALDRPTLLKVREIALSAAADCHRSPSPERCRDIRLSARDMGAA